MIKTAKYVSPFQEDSHRSLLVWECLVNVVPFKSDVPIMLLFYLLLSELPFIPPHFVKIGEYSCLWKHFHVISRKELFFICGMGSCSIRFPLCLLRLGEKKIIIIIIKKIRILYLYPFNPLKLYWNYLQRNNITYESCAIG